MFTEEQLREAISKSQSIRGVLIILGLAPKGGNYKTIKNKVKLYKIDTSHFKGQGYLKGKSNTWTIKIPLKNILVEDSSYTSSNRLKLRLINEGYKKKICEGCQNTMWLDQPIPLELEHKNGVNNDHRECNLLLLCPNCHALTPTYRGKNKHKPHT
jgi:hypothetical protein